MKLSGTFRRKIGAVCLVTSIIVVLAALLALVIDVPVENGLVSGAFVGLMLGSFEEFYVQSRAGRPLRAMHPVKSLLIYGAIVCLIFFSAQHLMHLALGRLDRLPEAYARLPIVLPLAFIISLVGVLALRIVGFIGAKTLFQLLIGRYHRPVVERKVLLFLDIRDSTAMVEALGPIKAKALIGKFLFDISKPITDHRGDIYLYTGDGLIGMWNWRDAIAENNIARAVDAINAAIEREKGDYLDAFGRVPQFRIGVHGGEVVISEQGDVKRAIGVYGDTINIAARMEQIAKTRGESCILSADIVEQLGGDKERFEFIGEESVKGISDPIPIYKYSAA